jgi:hypothetical protein
LILRVFNHVPRFPLRRTARVVQLRRLFSGNIWPGSRINGGSDVNQGSGPMTFVNRLSVITAYIALAFVGAIVLGVI